MVYMYLLPPYLLSLKPPESRLKLVVEMCTQLITIFTDNDQRDHLITHHGVMPILEMLEARQAGDYTSQVILMCTDPPLSMVCILTPSLSCVFKPHLSML
jgi:hypothetical protein